MTKGWVRPSRLGWVLVLYALIWLLGHILKYMTLTALYPGAYSGPGWRLPTYTVYYTVLDGILPAGYLAGGAGLILRRKGAGRLLRWNAAVSAILVVFFYLFFWELYSPPMNAASLAWDFTFRTVFHVLFFFSALRLKEAQGGILPGKKG